MNTAIALAVALALVGTTASCVYGINEREKRKHDLIMFCVERGGFWQEPLFTNPTCHLPAKEPTP